MKEATALIIGFIIIALVFSALIAFPVMWLVNGVFSNTTLVALFGGPIGFYKALGLSVLCHILFKSYNNKLE